jgi:hypothetical protein
VAKYSLVVSNVEAFKALRVGKVGVAPFTATADGSKKELSCRGSPLKTPANETYAAYIQKALVDELKMAGLYAADAPTQIKGHLAQIELNSINRPHWQMILIVTIGNTPSFKIERSYPFESSFIGLKACELAGQAFLPAVHDLLNALARDPRFAKAV